MDKFKGAFLDQFFPFEMREVKVLDFMNLEKGNKILKEYSLMFTQLAMYAPTMVVNSRSRIGKFMLGMSKSVVPP